MGWKNPRGKAICPFHSGVLPWAKASQSHCDQQQPVSFRSLREVWHHQKYNVPLAFACGSNMQLSLYKNQKQAPNVQEIERPLHWTLTNKVCFPKCSFIFEIELAEINGQIMWLCTEKTKPFVVFSCHWIPWCWGTFVLEGMNLGYEVNIWIELFLMARN